MALRFPQCFARHGVDTDGWSPGPDGCQQTLLHRAIDENNEDAAAFLIRKLIIHFNITLLFFIFDNLSQNLDVKLKSTSFRSGCDLNSPRREGAGGRGGEEAHDLATPLHLCCTWGLEAVVQVLLEHGANINAQVCFTVTMTNVYFDNFPFSPTLSQ